MTALRDYLSALEEHPWQRGVLQGVAIGIGIAIAGAVAGHSWEFVLASGAGVGLVMSVLFGFLLRIQGVGRGPGPRRPRR